MPDWFSQPRAPTLATSLTGCLLSLILILVGCSEQTPTTPANTETEATEVSHPRLLLFFFYRWETCVREATVLGM